MIFFGFAQVASVKGEDDARRDVYAFEIYILARRLTTRTAITGAISAAGTGLSMILPIFDSNFAWIVSAALLVIVIIAVFFLLMVTAQSLRKMSAEARSSRED
jgi:hypothetical protein